MHSLNKSIKSMEKSDYQPIRNRFRLSHFPIIKTMKITSFMMLGSALCVQASGYAQKVNISAKNASLKKVFKEITKQTNYQFFFRDEFIDANKTVSIDAKNKDMKEVLNTFLEGSGLTYSIVENTIVVRFLKISPPKWQLLLLQKTFVV
jgi:type II secretory pathway component GspD/PulD (secretin)